MYLLTLHFSSVNLTLCLSSLYVLFFWQETLYNVLCLIKYLYCIVLIIQHSKKNGQSANIDGSCNKNVLLISNFETVENLI